MKIFLSKFKELDKNEYLVILLMISAFISVYFSALMLIFIPFYILISKQINKLKPDDKSSYFLILFLIIAFISTIIFAKDSYIFEFHLKASYLKILSIIIFILPIDIFFFSKIITKRSFILSLKASMLMSIICFIIALIQKIFKLYASEQRPNRYASTFNNENYFGMAVVFAALISIYFFLNSAKKFDKYFSLISLICNIFSLWLCKSRTAFISLAISMLIIFFIANKKYFAIICGIIAVSSIVIIIYPSLLPRFDTSMEYLSYRFGIWKAALKCFSDNIFIGRGYYAFSGICVEYCDDIKYYALHSHNTYIELLLNFGIIGASFLAVYLFSVVKISIKNIKKCRSKYEMALYISILSALLVQALADTAIFWPQTGIIAAYILILPKVYESEI